MASLKDALDVLKGSTLEIEEYGPEKHDPLVSFEGLPGYEEIERYWVNAPYAFASINFHTKENIYLYYAVEPELDELEYELLDLLFDDMRDLLIYRTDLETGEPETLLRDELLSLLEEYGVTIDTVSFEKLFYYLNRSFMGYGRVDPLMHDPHIEDISCNGYGLPLYIYHDEYTNLGTNISYGREELDDFVALLAQQSGRQISLGQPVTGTTLPDGSRVELMYEKEATPKGSTYTIRKYSEVPYTPVDLINFNTFSMEMMAYLWLAVENNMSIMFVGGTASGKTTSMNAVSMFIPPQLKIVTIEDTKEITLFHENWVSGLTREAVGGGEEIDLFDLLKSSLRHRPEYIIVGEVRGKEAMTLFQAMNTGHTTFSTMHADSIQTVINRLENEPLNVPRSMVTSLDIVSVQRLTHIEENRVRRTDHIYEIEETDPTTGELVYSTVFSWDPVGDDFSKKRSQVLEKIEEAQGWSRSEVLREVANRKRVLSYLKEIEPDPGQFNSVINEYYLKPERVMERIETGSEVPTSD